MLNCVLYDQEMKRRKHRRKTPAVSVKIEVPGHNKDYDRENNRW